MGGSGVSGKMAMEVGTWGEKLGWELEVGT